MLEAFKKLHNSVYVYSSTTVKNSFLLKCKNWYTLEPPNNGQLQDGYFVHCSEVVTTSEVEMYGHYRGRDSLSIVGRLSTLWSVHY